MAASEDPVSTAYDLVVVGTGSAASSAASTCREAGRTVAVIDSRPFGGTCALRGCDPKKVLVGAAHLKQATDRMSRHGLAGEVRVDWADLMAFKRSFTAPVPESREASFRAQGIATYHGRARFLDRETLAVDTEAGTQRLKATHILLANGARPAPLPFDGADLLATSTDFLDLPELPRRLVFVGGGYISFEFAFIAAHAGARVTILHRGARPLDRFEPDLVDRLVAHARAAGIDVVLNAEVTGVAAQGSGYVVHTQTRAGEKASHEADLVVHGAGRVPALDDLDLDAGGVARGKGGVTVNAYLQSPTNPRVYAAGDAADTDGPPLTPVASMESRVAAANLLEGNHRTADYRAIPTVVFTTPPLASVGLTEAQARAQGRNVSVQHEDTSGWYSYRRVRAEAAAFKVLVDEAADRIVGAHLLGEGADELINVFTMALRYDIPASDLRQTLFAYPTHASDVPYML